MNSAVTNLDSDLCVNIAARLCRTAQSMPDEVAVAAPRGRDRHGKRIYEQISFAELDKDSDLLAAGLQSLGVTPGTKLALLVPPSIDFISLVFAIFKTGAVNILIDPGMGRKNLLRCLEETKPDGFVAVSLVHAVRVLMKKRFAAARMNVTVGRRWFWKGETVKRFRQNTNLKYQPVKTQADDPAAIIFTTGSTGPPKGVLYRHGNFDQQVDQIRDFYNIRPGEIDLPGFPLFALFNCAMGVTTVIPDMDPTRPAQVDPQKIIEAIEDWQITQSFGSPAIWNVVGKYCEQHSVKLPTLKRILSAGAPVPPLVLQRMKQAIADNGDIHTPYGATESLPVASISASEVLSETARESRLGAGTCVGKNFSGIRWKVIRIDENPIESLDEIKELPPGEIGELIVSGPVVTREYVTRVEANAMSKIADGQNIWHRMGDVGYFDSQGRFWFCGRKAHRVLTAKGTMYTIPCEAIYNNHEDLFRSALVGIGKPGEQKPVLIAEPQPGKMPETDQQKETLIQELFKLGKANQLTESIQDILLHPSLPVDIRHNAKIFREKLAVWAEEQLR